MSLLRDVQNAIVIGLRLLSSLVPIPVAAGFKTGVGVCGRSLAGAATGWSFVQRSPSECGMSGWDLEGSTKRSPSPREMPSHENRIIIIIITYYFLLHVSALLGHHQGQINTRGNMYKLLVCIITRQCSDSMHKTQRIIYAYSTHTG